MQKIVFSALLVICSYFSPAQSNFIPGKIILANGDTVRGLINDQHWEVNPTQIEFQKSTAGVIEKLDLHTLQGFMMSNGILFEKHYVKFDDSREEPTFLSASRDPLTYAEGEYFLSVHLKGGVSLSSLTDGNGRVHYFIHEDGKKPIELLNRSFHTSVNGRPIIRTFEAWKQHLAIISTRCEKMSDKITSAKYTRQSLEKIVREINLCMGTPVESIKSEPQQRTSRKPEFGIIGQAFSVYTGYAEPFTTTTTKYDGINFGGGIFSEIFFRGRTSLYSEVKVKSISLETKAPLTPLFKMTSVRLVTAIRKTFSRKKAGVFVDFGLTNGFRTASYSYKDATPGSIFDRTDEEKKFETGVVVGFGAKIPIGKVKLSPRITYEYETPLKAVKFDAVRSLGFVMGIGL